MTDANLMTPRAFAASLGFKPHYGHQLQKDGRLVMAPDGKHCLVAESRARWEATRDPSKAAVAERHAAGRVAAPDDDQDDQDDQNAAPAYATAQAGGLGNSYQQARAVKEKFLALEAKRAYEVAIGQLREGREVEGLAATAMTELRIRLENLATTLAPMLTGQADETKVRAMLQDQFAHALESASHHFARLAAGAKT